MGGLWHRNTLRFGGWVITRYLFLCGRVHGDPGKRNGRGLHPRGQPPVRCPKPGEEEHGTAPHFRGYPAFPPLKWKPRGIRCQPRRGVHHQAPIDYGDSHQRDLMERFSLPPGRLPSPRHEYPPRHCNPDQQDTRGLPAFEHTGNLLRGFDVDHGSYPAPPGPVSEPPTKQKTPCAGPGEPAAQP